MKNWTGYELAPAEAALVDVYEELYRILRDDGADLAPYQRRNAVKALACLWQVANGLDMDPGQPFDAGA